MKWKAFEALQPANMLPGLLEKDLQLEPADDLHVPVPPLAAYLNGSCFSYQWLCPPVCSPVAC